MIKHIVMWQLKDQAEGKTKEENAVIIKDLLEALVGEIEGLVKVEVGINICDSDQAFDVVLYSELRDEAALEYYRTHPLHQEAGAYIGKVRGARTVVDYRAE